MLAVRNSAAFSCSYCQTSAVPGGFEPLDEELIQEEMKRREQDEILERKKKKEARFILYIIYYVHNVKIVYISGTGSRAR